MTLTTSPATMATVRLRSAADVQHDLTESREPPINQPHHVAYVEYDAEELAATFHTLADQWWYETAILSVIQRKITHPAYQRIIGLGPAVVPLILAELAERPSHWFWALQCITGENPVSPEDNLGGAREAWLHWGRACGYLT